MSKTWIRFGSQHHWFEDEPAAIWFRVTSLNLCSEELYSLRGRHFEELRDELMMQSELYGGSNCMGVDLDEWITTAADKAYFALVVRRVNEIFEEFGDVVESHSLKALGFSGQIANACDTTSIRIIGTTVHSMFSCT